MVKNKHERGRKYASKETFVHCICVFHAGKLLRNFCRSS